MEGLVLDRGVGSFSYRSNVVSMDIVYVNWELGWRKYVASLFQFFSIFLVK